MARKAKALVTAAQIIADLNGLADGDGTLREHIAQALTTEPGRKAILEAAESIRAPLGGKFSLSLKDERALAPDDPKLVAFKKVKALRTAVQYASKRKLTIKSDRKAGAWEFAPVTPRNGTRGALTAHRRRLTQFAGWIGDCLKEDQGKTLDILRAWRKAIGEMENEISKGAGKAQDKVLNDATVATDAAALSEEEARRIKKERKAAKKAAKIAAWLAANPGALASIAGAQ